MAWAAPLAHAAGITKADCDAGKTRIKADDKGAIDPCDALAGEAKAGQGGLRRPRHSDLRQDLSGRCRRPHAQACAPRHRDG
ncbi:MAG: hypothetical protein AB9M60_15390 [Leptothrix sp. (in: b-proteobacteria)]